MAKKIEWAHSNERHNKIQRHCFKFRGLEIWQGVAMLGGCWAVWTFAECWQHWIGNWHIVDIHDIFSICMCLYHVMMLSCYVIWYCSRMLSKYVIIVTKRSQPRWIKPALIAFIIDTKSQTRRQRRMRRAQVPSPCSDMFDISTWFAVWTLWTMQTNPKSMQKT